MPKLPNSPACELLGCSLPLVLAGMGGVARHELVAAVTAAGGFGFLGMVREPPALITSEIEALRRLGHRRFGVNIIPAATDPALLEHQVMTCIQLAVPVVGTFWDLDEHVTERLRSAGILVVHQVGSVAEAIAAERAGVGIIIAQGREAGGHVRGTRPLRALLPEIADAIGVPVLAAGGLVTGGDLVTAMALGASGIVLGTALMATEESFAHPYHKQRLLAAGPTDTRLTDSFHINWPPGAPVRVLKTEVTEGQRGDSRAGTRTVIGAEGNRPIYLFSTDSPLRSMSGDFEAMALYAGTGVGQIDSCPPAASRIDAIVAEAEALLALQDVAEEVGYSSPACFAHEVSGAYMGHLDTGEILDELGLLFSELQAVLRAAPRPVHPPLEAPPFAPDDVELARWCLRLEALSLSLGGGSLPRSSAASDPAACEASALTRLGRMVPRLGEPRLRDPLAELLALLQARRLAALTEGTLRLPPRRSNESLDASGR